jgi:hypothetical protein
VLVDDPGRDRVAGGGRDAGEVDAEVDAPPVLASTQAVQWHEIHRDPPDAQPMVSHLTTSQA